MGLELLNAIGMAKNHLNDFTKQAVSLHVPAIKRNYQEITGIDRDRSFFYREAGISDDQRRTKFQAFADFYFATATANRQSGKLLEVGFASCVNVVDRFLINRRLRGFWDIEESLSNGMVDLRKAKVNGDPVKLLLAASKLQTDVSELLSSLTVTGVNFAPSATSEV